MSHGRSLGGQVDYKMEPTTGKANYLINASGCGMFQVLMVLCVDVMLKAATVYTMVFMVFGIYNPGWRCLDVNNSTTTSSAMNNSLITLHNANSDIITDTPADTSASIPSTTANENGDDYYSTVSSNYTSYNQTLSNPYSQGSCNVFKACQNIEFDPDTSTIVSEWGLLCDKAWIPSFMISIQMGGILVGSLVAGQLGDTFGRKKILYMAVATLGVLSILARFSTYWEAFTVIRFLIGVTIACMYNLYNILPAEFLNSAWRVRLASIPSWHIGGLIFAIIAMLIKNWAILHLIVGVYCILACLPAIWVPESLRWLEVKSKSKQFKKVAEKMLTMNKVTISVDDCFDNKAMLSVDDKKTVVSEPACKQKPRVYNVTDLFRKGYRLNSVILAYMWVSATLSYYAISFGVKAMYGDFYVNLMVLFAADIPYSFIPMYVPNLIGRKRASMLFISISATSLLISAALGFWAPAHIRNTGSLILAMIAKMNTVGCMSCNLVLTTEMYPTVVRSNAIGYCNFMARIGGIMAPLFVPSDSRYLHHCYGVLGLLCFVGCLISIKLPETKGKTLKETFDED